MGFQDTRSTNRRVRFGSWPCKNALPREVGEEARPRSVSDCDRGHQRLGTDDGLPQRQWPGAAKPGLNKREFSCGKKSFFYIQCMQRRICGLSNKMEMTMRKKTLTALVVALISALTVQAAAASEHHHSRAKSRAAAWAQMRNSNAYAAPGYPAGSDFKAEQSYFTNMGNGYSAGGY
jgi:hypothetical protein